MKIRLIGALILLLMAVSPLYASDDDPETPSSDSSLPTCLYYLSFDDDRLAIFRLEADGMSRTRLSNIGSDDSFPSPSPDGGKIAFTSLVAGNNDLYVMDTNGDSIFRITETDWNESNPSWTSDSSKIIFESNQYGNYELIIYDFVEDKFTRLTENSYDDYAPSVSPAGRMIAFGSDRDAYSEIYIAPLSNVTNALRLTNNNGLDYGPDWSPTGDRVTFESLRPDNPEPQVYILDIDTRQAIQLTDSNFANVSPDWSPDGDLIAYVSYEPDATKIYAVNLNTNRVRLLIENAYRPVWCPISNHDEPDLRQEAYDSSR